MTALSFLQTPYAVALGVEMPAGAQGGTAPYTFAVAPGGAGGTINPLTGLYTAPSVFARDARGAAKLVETLQVIDVVNATATVKLLVGTHLHLVADIIQRVLGLADGRVYLWDQKILEPADAGLFVALSVPLVKPVGYSNRFNGDTGNLDQFVTMSATVDIDVISRSTAARDMKEQVLMALSGTYAEQQMAANSFWVSPLGRFVNLSEVDGASIPYRFRVSVQMQYAVSQAQPSAFFDQFQTPTVFVDQGTNGGQIAGTPIPTGGGTEPSGTVIIDGGSA